MKILIVNSFYYPNIVGGAEYSVKNIAETLAEKGYDVHVLCIDKEYSYKLLNGVKVHSIKNLNIKNSLDYNKSQNGKVEKILYRSIELIRGINTYDLKNIIQKINPDIIHINNFAGFGYQIFRTIKKLKIPFIFTARDYYSICPKSTFINSMGCECINSKIICKIYKKLYISALKSANYITAPSKFVLDTIFKETKINKSRFVNIHNSIDIDMKVISKIYEKKVDILNKKDTLNLVFVGRLETHKGLNLLVENFKKLKNKRVILHIAGDGTLKDFILKSSCDTNIVFHGMLEKQNLEKLLEESCDVLLAPSLWNEPFGRVVLDAYKHCLPVITTGSGGLKELVKDNYTGKIIDFKNYEEFSMTILNYLDNKKLLLSQYKNCSEEIKNYSNEFIVDKYIVLYKKSINKLNVTKS